MDLIAERGLPRPTARARTEVEVNSHAGEPAPAGHREERPVEGGAKAPCEEVMMRTAQ